MAMWAWLEGLKDGCVLSEAERRQFVLAGFVKAGVRGESRPEF